MSDDTDSKAVRALMELGLTNSQARVYYALAQSGNGSATDISRISKVTRQEIYHIMRELQKKELVQKRFGLPITWKATPFDDALTILLEERNEHQNDLNKSIQEVLNNFRPKKKDERRCEELVILPAGRYLKDWAKKTIQETQKSWDSFAPLNFVYKTSLLDTEKCMLKALKRDVKFRKIFFVDSDFERNKKMVLQLGPYSTHPNMNHRFVYTPSRLVGMVKDGKEAWILIQSQEETKPQILWSQNSIFLELVQSYFEMLWKQAQDL
jgi:sugar-specific transcriptional regulator TrmB